MRRQDRALRADPHHRPRPLLPHRGRGRGRVPATVRGRLDPRRRQTGQMTRASGPDNSRKDAADLTQDGATLADLPGSGAEPVNQHPVTQAPVAHHQGFLFQLVHHRPDDARAGEDDLGAFRLQSDDRSTASASRDRYSSIWRSISSRSRTAPWTASGSYVSRPGSRRSRLVIAPPIADQGVGRRAAVQAVRGRRRSRRGRSRASRPRRRVEPETLGVAHRADIDAEAFVDVRSPGRR